MSDDTAIDVVPVSNLVKRDASPDAVPTTPLTMEQSVDNEMTALIPLAGTLQLTDAQKTALYSPINEESIEIRPDGLIYLPWMEYVTRMRDAFGAGWALIPKGLPYSRGNLVLWGFWLVIDGKPMGFAVGEQSCNSPGMTAGDQFEGAKSNARMRLCKDLGIGLELWSPAFLKKWKAKYAEKGNDGKWKKREPIVDAPIPASASKFDYLADYKKAKDAMGSKLYYEIMGQSGYEHANEIPVANRKPILDTMRAAHKLNQVSK